MFSSITGNCSDVCDNIPGKIGACKGNLTLIIIIVGLGILVVILTCLLVRIQYKYIALQEKCDHVADQKIELGKISEIVY